MRLSDGDALFLLFLFIVSMALMVIAAKLYYVEETLSSCAG